MGSKNFYLSQPLHNFSLPPFSNQLVGNTEHASEETPKDVSNQRSKNRKKITKALHGSNHEKRGSDQPSDTTFKAISSSGSTQTMTTDHHQQPEIATSAADQSTKDVAAAADTKKEKKKKRAGVTLSRQEIEEDIAEIAKLVGKKLRRNPMKKKSSKNLDYLFPGNLL